MTASDEKGDLLGEIIAGKHRIDQLGGGVDGIYLRKPGDAQSWLARGTLDLPADTLGWLDRKVIDLPQEKIKEVVLIQPDGSKLDLARDKPEDPLALKGAPATAKLKSDTAAGDPANALASVELADVRPAADMAFPKEGVGRAEYTSFDGIVGQAHAGRSRRQELGKDRGQRQRRWREAGSRAQRQAVALGLCPARLQGQGAQDETCRPGRAAEGLVSDADPASPCTAVCVLDSDSGYCRGCFRTVAEISAWGSLGRAEKLRILTDLPARRPRAGFPAA